MPYAEPTSPLNSPRAPLSPTLTPVRNSRSPRRVSQNLQSDPSPRLAQPTLPRRASTSPTPPRKASLPGARSNAAAVGALEAMRQVESLRRPPAHSSTASPSFLGLKIHASPIDSPTVNSDDRFPSFTSFSRWKHPPHSPPPKVSLLQRQRQTRDRAVSSASLPSPEDTPISPTPLSPRDAMVRKKSGEVVKSSLKRRALSTPDLGRDSGEEERTLNKNGSRSTRDLPDHSKSVRFPDVGIEKVVLFLRGQKPIAVSKTADTNEIPTETEDEHDTDLSDYVHFRTRRNGSPSLGPEPKEVQIDVGSTVPRIRVDFGPGTQGLLKNEFVLLERVEMVNTTTTLAMRGTVLVRNVSFQKWVAVRFTLDNWQTVSEVSAQHVSHIPAATTGDEGWDRFSFTVKLDDHRRKIEERTLFLCVRYSIEGTEWWDSNRGDNYRFTFKHVPIRRRHMATPMRPASPHRPHSPHLGNNFPILPLLEKAAERKSPLNWVFPRTAPATQQVERQPSPVQAPPPAVAFKPPPSPDVHSVLGLKKWCAPSPPQSPPKHLAASHSSFVLPLAPVRAHATPPPMIVHGHPANTWQPASLPPHERNHSWAGKPSPREALDVVSISDTEEPKAGETTPTAARARSPVGLDRSPVPRDTSPFCVPTQQPPATAAAPSEPPVTLRAASPTASAASTPSASEDEKPSIPLTRSTNDLRSLVENSAAGLMTPPSSNLSSPPTPSGVLAPESPTTSMSTGDSSPVNVLLPDSRDDDDSTELDRRRTLNAATYQEFLDKFCFYQSPSMNAPTEFPHPSYIPLSSSGYSSPLEIGGFYGRGTPTPTPQTYDSYFAGAPNPEPTVPVSNASAASSTPRATTPTPSTPPNEKATNGPLKAGATVDDLVGQMSSLTTA